MNRLKKLMAIGLSILTVSGASVIGSGLSAEASGTGTGLAEWALNAYYSNWSYVYGGSTPGTVDCSGLIWTYCGGNRVDMLGTSTASGSVSAGIPNIHGLGLYQPGHVGVYVGNGMEVDARSEYYGVCYQSVASNWTGWSYWFKLAAVTYPDTGWEEFNGDYYYYENGEYITNTSRTIGGETYYFDSSGASSTTPSSTSSTASSGSSGSSSSSSSSSSSGASSTAKKSVWSYGDSGSEVEKIQTRLSELGYYSGSIDGEFDSATEKAFKAFQTAAGLYPDGVAGSDRDVLYSDYAPYYTEPETEPEQEDNDAEDTTAEAQDEQQTEDADEAEDADDAIAAIAMGDFSDDVASVQSRLAELGYFGLEATGFFGDYTAQAVAEFQKANGLEPTGEIDEATYSQLFSEDAVENETAPVEYTESMNSGAAETTGPVQILGGTITTPSAPVISSNGFTTANYADSASQVVKKTNEATNKALSKSSGIIPTISLSKVKRSANVWLWFVLTAIILAAISIVILSKSKKTSRYEKYAAKKKKNSTKAQLNARW